METRKIISIALMLIGATGIVFFTYQLCKTLVG